jgi:hypothetical protein
VGSLLISEGDYQLAKGGLCSIQKIKLPSKTCRRINEFWKKLETVGRWARHEAGMGERQGMRRAQPLTAKRPYD